MPIGRRYIAIQLGPSDTTLYTLGTAEGTLARVIAELAGPMVFEIWAAGQGLNASGRPPRSPARGRAVCQPEALQGGRVFNPARPVS